MVTTTIDGRRVTQGTAAAKKLAPKKRVVERRNRNASVIQAAIEVMSERGYAGTSIQEVADKVGVLKGSLYYYFSSKEELLFRVLEESWRETSAFAAEAAGLGLEPIDELAAYFRRLATWYLQNVDHANIFFSQTGNLTGERKAVTDERSREFVDHIRGLVRTAQERGQIGSSLNYRLIARYVLGSLNNVRTWPTTGSTPFSADEMADAFVELTMNALLVPRPAAAE